MSEPTRSADRDVPATDPRDDDTDPARLPPSMVVGVAVVADGRVLAARRTSPPALAGGWELPGGKVEPGEDPAAAAVRETFEELGCTVRVIGWLTGSSRIDQRYVLRVALARLVAGTPVPTEHDLVRWLAPDELDQVDWLAADRPLLPDLAESIRTLATP